MGIKRRFSKEFKLSILKELETKRLAEVCRAHNITPSTVCGGERITRLTLRRHSRDMATYGRKILK